ncbi:PIH1 domain-containing protein 2-like [Gigantopelta aegis]|uniref:PIH1 domain-containing protein 2-like n=1 Tax=Gigantopelta aegis TaxID=1735272 RepID=UPI001B889E57|nr:PIH1 domain-containing protein 2-like [Gigantopelta aegis]
MEQMSSGKYDTESMMHQAQHMWTMLDEMATSNPQAYREFINKQLQEGREQMAPPQPHMCIKTNLLKPLPVTMYINVCGWKRIPPPKSEEEPVSVMGTSLQTVQDQSGTFTTISVAFNLGIIEKFGRNSENPADRDTLIQLSMDYIEEQQKVKISRIYEILDDSILYKGDLSDIHASFAVKNKSSDKQFENNLDELEKSCGPLAAGAKDSLLNQLKNIAVSDNQSGTQSTTRPDISVLSTNGAGKSVLIEEINTSQRLPVPKHELSCVKSDASQEDVLVLNIMLPNVHSVAECELDISEDDISMNVPTKYELYVKLPRIIKENDSTAKFNKKNSTLTLRMPVLR